MPGISVVDVMESQRAQHSVDKLRRRTLRDASDPLSYPNSMVLVYVWVASMLKYDKLFILLR